jgi:osmotically inducible lipoprotein OsmB
VSIPNKARISAVILLALMLAACTGEPLSTREKGTLFGGALGAGTGAIVGAAVGHPGTGAAIGGGLGVVSGALVGNQMQNQEIEEQQTRGQVAVQQGEIERQRREIQRLESEVETE